MTLIPTLRSWKKEKKLKARLIYRMNSFQKTGEENEPEEKNQERKLVSIL